MPICSLASEEESSSTSGLPQVDSKQNRSARPPYWGEEMVTTSAKAEAVKKVILANTQEDSATHCWQWTAGTSHGYGQLRLHDIYGSTPVYAHRVAYVVFTGKLLPKGAVVRHLCNNELCCNPEHIAVGTQADNIADMVKTHRQASGEKNGMSKLTEEDVITIRKLYQQGEIYNAIGKRYGISGSQVFRIVIGERWGHVKEGIIEKPTAHRNSKLTLAQVEEAYNMRDEGFPVNEIARYFKITGPTLRGIFAGKTWKEVYLRRAGNSESS